MARIAASCTCSGAGKSGWPMQKLMMSLPARASALTSARTTKAFSVPRLEARRLICGMRIPVEKYVLCRPMLVNCVAYRDGKRIADIEPHEISDYVKQEGAFVWVALKDSTEAEL